MSLPPGVLAQQLAKTFPQFILCDLALGGTLSAYLNPGQNQAVSDLVQWLQENPVIATATGDILNPNGAPQTTAAPLDPTLVAALAPVLTSTSSWIVTQPPFAGVAWTIQNGVPPGPVTPQSATGAWTLDNQGPIGGLVFSRIAYSGAPSNNFTLTLVNDAPRHLSVYAAFSSAGAPVTPANWTSRLPSGAPAGFESNSVKYLGMLVPNASVAGISVAPTTQSLSFPLPSNADAVQLMFGGLGNDGFNPIPDAAGALLTFVLDIFVPWVVVNSGQSNSNVSKWFAGLLADPAVIAKVLLSGSFLIGVSGANAMFTALSANATGMMLGKPLTKLRDAIADELGPPPRVDYSWVDQFAPAAGWAAQLVQEFLAGGLNAQYWAAATSSTIALDLSPSTTLALDLTLTPDPKSGIWPYPARSYVVEINYGGGFSQTLSGNAPSAQRSAPIVVSFGSVPKGPIAISAKILDAAAATVAQAAARVAPPVRMTSRNLPVHVAVTDIRVAIGAYARVARLTYAGGAYVWDSSHLTSAAAGLNSAPGNAPALSALTCLTLQGDELCLGYAWGVANQQTTQCGRGAPLQNPYYIQNIGTAAPAAQLKTVNCGFVVAPQLAYSPIADDQPRGRGFYVDTQGAGVFLRHVAFGPGVFDLPSGLSVAQFPAQSGPIAVCLHPDGYAAAVNVDRNILQIVELASAPVADASAPMALAHCGAGARIGLLSGPVAVAAMPNGAFIVLEQGNARVQAFDIRANPVSLFAGQPMFALRSVPQPAYRDLAVSATGAIYVLGSQNGGGTPSDFFLDIYDGSGSLLKTTQGVNAAKIALDAGLTLYTLDFDSLTGPGGRIEPALSVWRPKS